MADCDGDDVARGIAAAGVGTEALLQDGHILESHLLRNRRVVEALKDNASSRVHHMDWAYRVQTSHGDYRGNNQHHLPVAA